MKYIKLLFLILICFSSLISCAFQPKLPELPKLSEFPSPSWLQIDGYPTLNCVDSKSNVLLTDSRPIENPANIINVNAPEAINIFSETLESFNVTYKNFDGKNYISRKERLSFDRVILLNSISLLNRYGSDGTFLDAEVSLTLYKSDGRLTKYKGSGTMRSSLVMKDIMFAPNILPYERLERAFENLFKQELFVKELCVKYKHSSENISSRESPLGIHMPATLSHHKLRAI